MTPNIIQIPNPNTFQPRDYQLPFWQAADKISGVKRHLLIWHRRAGKDWAVLNKMAYKILVEEWDTPGVYVYLAGKSAKQGAGITWGNRTNDGLSYLDAFPKELIKKKDDREYSIEFTNGSIFRVCSTIDPDAMRGWNPKGVVFSEFDYIPKAGYWFRKVISPMLLSNGGWLMITTTPDGVKQTYDLYVRNQDNAKWFIELRTIEDTIHNGQRIFGEEQLEEAIADGATEADIQQEYYCDFFAESGGTFYEKQFRKIREEGRVREVPYDSALPVHTFWDLGVRDSTVIWFAQIDWSGNWRIIDYYENNSQGIDHYVKECNKKPYTYGTHFAPHDIKQREMGTGVSVQETALKFGMRFVVAPSLTVLEGINAVRALLSVCYFDLEKTFEGIEALKHYKKKESVHSDQLGNPMFTSEPVHDWASHAADAFRVMGVCRELAQQTNYVTSAAIKDLPTHARFDYDVHNGL